MNDASAPRLERAVPVLASLDIGATLAFSRDRLGFAIVAEHPDYGICRRDDIEIHFWLTTDERIPKETSCRVVVAGIDALYAEMQAADVVHPNGPLERQPWGMTEFAVLDGDGNMIKFAESTG